LNAAQAQSTASVWAPKSARPERALSVYVQWNVAPEFDAVRIRLPKRWELIQVEQVDATRMRRMPLTTQKIDKGWIADGLQSVSQPLRVVVVVRPDDANGLAEVRIDGARLRPSKDGFEIETVGDPVRTEIRVEPPSNDSGHALDLRQSDRLQLLTNGAPTMPKATSFTTEFWFETIDRDVVMLSTWDGDEAKDYPFEFVIDAGGNLRCYTGKGGMHYSVVSSEPVADGGWHHAAYVRDGAVNTVSLYLDGKLEDSVFLPVRGESATYPIAIGGRVGASASDLSGRFDELRIWTSARTGDMIAAETRVPGRSIPDRPNVLLDFESVEVQAGDDGTPVVASDLALHQPVFGASVTVTPTAVDLEWRLRASEAQTITLQRSEDGAVFVPVYLIAAAARDERGPSTERSYSFSDVDLDGSSVFYYRFVQSFDDGSRLVSNMLKVGLGDDEVPLSFNLIGNSPNPFFNTTQVFFEVSRSMHVRLSVWDISGHLVDWLIDRSVEPGMHQVTFDSETLPSGTYCVRMESEEGVMTRKMILSK